ncbi:MAG: 50S ribosomal protein L23 [bacterium]
MATDAYDIIEKTVISERTSLLREQGNKYVFKVSIKANKNEIRKAVEELFKVDVIKVNTSIMSGKRRRMGKYEGIRPDWKKAIVTVKEGQEIKAIEEKA